MDYMVNRLKVHSGTKQVSLVYTSWKMSSFHGIISWWGVVFYHLSSFKNIYLNFIINIIILVFHFTY